MSDNKRILIAADASDASRRAVNYVAEVIGNRPGYHVGLVHVELPPRMLEWGGAEDPAVEASVSAERAREYRGMEQEAVDKGRAMLRGLLDGLAKRGTDVTALLVKFDEPLDPEAVARDVLKTAREKDYGTVVVGRKSFSWLERMMHHHVGEELVRTGEGKAIWVIE